MNALVIYDSVFGNTEKIGQAIGQALTSKANVTTLSVGDVKPEQLNGIELLIVGSPTRGFRPTPAIANFLKALPDKSLAGVKVAAFDTRFDVTALKGFLKWLVRKGGYAADKIAKVLVSRGGEQAVAPAGFDVTGKEGPLKSGELERAAEWARGMV
jgi:flavodoxin